MRLWWLPTVLPRGDTGGLVPTPEPGTGGETYLAVSIIPHMLTITEGQSATFTCNAIGKFSV